MSRSALPEDGVAGAADADGRPAVRVGAVPAPGHLAARAGPGEQVGGGDRAFFTGHGPYGRRHGGGRGGHGGGRGRHGGGRGRHGGGRGRDTAVAGAGTAAGATRAAPAAASVSAGTRTMRDPPLGTKGTMQDTVLPDGAFGHGCHR
ncbi:hypothetical protein GCM10017687_28860 [Streptomyces echinatus]